MKGTSRNCCRIKSSAFLIFSVVWVLVCQTSHCSRVKLGCLDSVYERKKNTMNLSYKFSNTKLGRGK